MPDPVELRRPGRRGQDTIAYAQANLLPSSITTGIGQRRADRHRDFGLRPGRAADHHRRPARRHGRHQRASATISPAQVIGSDLARSGRRRRAQAPRQPRRPTIATARSAGSRPARSNSQSDADWAAFASLETVDIAYDGSARPIRQTLTGSDGNVHALTQISYDNEGRPQCTAQRMNPSEFAPASLPADACTLDTPGQRGPDRISRTTYDDANRVDPGRDRRRRHRRRRTRWRRPIPPMAGRRPVTDAEGNRTTYEYDGHDRLSATLFPIADHGPYELDHRL